VEPVGPDLQPLRVARGAENPDPAAEGDQKLAPTAFAAHPREPRLQHAAIEKPLDGAPCPRPQPAVSWLELVLVNPDERLEVILDQPVERGLLRPARLVGARRQVLHAAG